MIRAQTRPNSCGQYILVNDHKLNNKLKTNEYNTWSDFCVFLSFFCFCLETNKRIQVQIACILRLIPMVKFHRNSAYLVDLFGSLFHNILIVLVYELFTFTMATWTIYLTVGHLTDLARLCYHYPKFKNLYLISKSWNTAIVL